MRFGCADAATSLGTIKPLLVQTTLACGAVQQVIQSAGLRCVELVSKSFTCRHSTSQRHTLCSAETAGRSSKQKQQCASISSTHTTCLAGCSSAYNQRDQITFPWNSRALSTLESIVADVFVFIPVLQDSALQSNAAVVRQHLAGQRCIHVQPARVVGCTHLLRVM